MPESKYEKKPKKIKRIKPHKKPKKLVLLAGRSALKPGLPVSTDDRKDRDPPHLMYRAVEKRYFIRMSQLKMERPEVQLNFIEFEINLRTKLTQQEVFFIGELLVHARELLKGNRKINFKDWVTENFEFGYHTAINFCNVFTACIGQMDLLDTVRSSVLYEISSKKFPKTLRDFLIFNKSIERVHVKDLKEIYQEYKENGFEAVRLKLEKTSMIPLLINQELVPYLDSLSQLTHYVDKQIYELERRARRIDPSIFVVGADKNRSDNYFIVSDSLKECLEVLKETKKMVYQQKTELYKIKDDNLIELNHSPWPDYYEED